MSFSHWLSRWTRKSCPMRRDRLPRLESLEDRALPATINWMNAGSGNFDTAANWSTGSVPGAGDDVVINTASSATITVKMGDSLFVHSITTAAGDTLAVSNGSLTLLGNSSLAGALSLSGSSRLLVNTSLSVGGTLTENSGELTGPGNVTVTGTLTWTGGTMSGPGVTDAKGGLVLGMPSATSNSSDILAGRTLVNEGTAVWYARNTLTQQSSSTFENLSSATLTINGGASWGSDTTDSDNFGSFDNQGTFVVAAGTSSTVVQPFFSNEGSVQVGSGTLVLGGGGTATGSFSVPAGTTLVLGNNENYETFTFNSGSTVSGAGTVLFGSGEAVNFTAGSTFNVSGTTVINTGGNTDANVVFWTDTVEAVGNLTIESGVVNFSTGGTVSLTSLTQSGGALTGPDSVVVVGPTTWTGGTMNGTGSTTAAGGLTLGANDGSSHTELLSARTFLNPAQATWVGTGEIDLDWGCTFVNQVGATFAEQTDLPIYTNVGTGQEPSGTFNNEGTFTVAASGGTALMEPFLDNSGSVEIQSGTWELSGNGSATGSFQVDAGTTFDLNMYYAGGTISGPGTVTLIQGSQAVPSLFTGGVIPVTNGPKFFDVQGNVTASSLTLNAGGFLIVYGTLTVTGPVVIDGGYIVGPGTIIAQGGLQLGTVGGDQQFIYGTTLINAGTATLFGQAQISLVDGSTLINEANASLAIQGGGGSVVGDGTSNIVNQGSITAAVGTGSKLTLDYTTLTNTGSVAVSSGTLDLETGGTSNGGFSAASGSTLTLGHSPWYFNSGANVSGAGTVQFGTDVWPTAFNAGSTYNVSGTTIIGATDVDLPPAAALRAWAH